MSEGIKEISDLIEKNPNMSVSEACDEVLETITPDKFMDGNPFLDFDIVLDAVDNSTEALISSDDSVEKPFHGDF